MLSPLSDKQQNTIKTLCRCRNNLHSQVFFFSICSFRFDPPTHPSTHLEDLEGAHERLVDGHHGTGVVELAAVVGRREESDQLALREELVAVLHHLADQKNGREKDENTGENA